MKKPNNAAKRKLAKKAVSRPTKVTIRKLLTGVRGLYIKEVDPNGLAAEVRLASGAQALGEGDVITRLNRVPVTTLADFQRVLNGLASQ